MSLTVNLDTYLSQSDATLYVTANYASTDAQYIAWNALSTGDKDARLRKATKIIDRQPIAGFKVVYNQVLAFPRAIQTDAYGLNIPTMNLVWGNGYYVQPSPPDAVKNAQVELALYLMTGTSKRLELQREGVKSFSVGNLSENYGSGKSNPLPYEVRELLKPFLASSVNIS